MDLMEKLKILADSAKYDVACTSSGVERAGKHGMLGSTSAPGICHSFSADGRCISLLKVLFTNICIYDCQYCVNRCSNDVPRAAFLPDELAELTINFYKRNYIEGLFLSSAIVKSPDYTMELLCKTLYLIRNKYKFNGYIHLKAIPGADEGLIKSAGLLADRMSVNIELPSEKSLKLLAPEKSKISILEPMKAIRNQIVQSKEEIMLYKHAPEFVPAGQSTQMIVGATPDTDGKIVTLAQSFYKKIGLKRVFYTAYNPVVKEHPLLPTVTPPLLREHRLYQADWLMRFYGFSAQEIVKDENSNLDLNMDPKCGWALRNLNLFPLEINRAPYELLLRVPGIGVRSALRIVKARKVTKLSFENLKKMRIVLKRAQYFITCDGRMYRPIPMDEGILRQHLSENKIGEAWQQLSFQEPANLLPTKEDEIKCLTGEI